MTAAVLAAVLSAAATAAPAAPVQPFDMGERELIRCAREKRDPVCIGELSRRGGPAPTAALRGLSSSRDPGTRALARVGLAILGDEGMFRGLIADLSSREFQTRMRAIWALDGIGNRAAVPHLVALLDDDSPFMPGWGSVVIGTMWDLEMLTRGGAAPGPWRRLVARGCAAAWVHTEPGWLWDVCARWTTPSSAPPPEGLEIAKSRAYWKSWWRAHHGEYEGLTFERGRRP